MFNRKLIINLYLKNNNISICIVFFFEETFFEVNFVFSIFIEYLECVKFFIE